MTNSADPLRLYYGLNPTNVAKAVTKHMEFIPPNEVLCWKREDLYLNFYSEQYTQQRALAWILDKFSSF